MNNRKYRVWDEDKKCWVKSTDWIKYAITTDGIIMECHEGTYRGGGWCNRIADGNYTIEWYTGKIDNNDIDVWEGDKLLDRNTGDIGIVVWSEKELKFCLRLKDGDNIYEIALAGMIKMFDTVIGNIHEEEQCQQK